MRGYRATVTVAALVVLAVLASVVGAHAGGLTPAVDDGSSDGVTPPDELSSATMDSTEGAIDAPDGIGLDDRLVLRSVDPSGDSAPGSQSSADGAAADVGSTDGGTAAAAAEENGSVSPSPGAHLSGVVEEHNASLAGDVHRRSFSIRYENASSSASRARIVAQEYRHVDSRIDALDDRRQRLTAQFENGTLSPSAYHTRARSIYAQSRALKRMANDTGRNAASVPDAALAKHGLGPDAIGRLQDDARNLTGLGVANEARSGNGNRGRDDQDRDDRDRGDQDRDDRDRGDQGRDDRGPDRSSEPGSDVNRQTGTSTTVPEADAAIRTASSQIASARYHTGAGEFFDPSRQGLAMSKIDDASEHLSGARRALEIGATDRAVRLAERATDAVDGLSPSSASE